MKVKSIYTGILVSVLLIVIGCTPASIVPTDQAGTEYGTVTISIPRMSPFIAVGSPDRTAGTMAYGVADIVYMELYDAYDVLVDTMTVTYYDSTTDTIADWVIPAGYGYYLYMEISNTESVDYALGNVSVSGTSDPFDVVPGQNTAVGVMNLPAYPLNPAEGVAETSLVENTWGERWFEFTAGDTLTIAELTSVTGDLNLYIFDSNGYFIGKSESTGGYDVVQFASIAGQTYYAMVHAYSSGTYDFVFNSMLNPMAFAEYVESGAPGWTTSVAADGLDSGNLWHLTTTESYSGTTSFWLGQESTGNYSTGYRVHNSLYSPAIDLSAYSGYSLSMSFMEKYETEGAPYDLAAVLVSSDNANWFTLREYSATGISGGGASPVWVNTVFDVSSYAGGMLYIQFDFDSGDEFSNSTLGWLVDDVEVFVP